MGLKHYIKIIGVLLWIFVSLLFLVQDIILLSKYRPILANGKHSLKEKQWFYFDALLFFDFQFVLYIMMVLVMHFIKQFKSRVFKHFVFCLVLYFLE